MKRVVAPGLLVCVGAVVFFFPKQAVQAGSAVGSVNRSCACFGIEARKGPPTAGSTRGACYGIPHACEESVAYQAANAPVPGAPPPSFGVHGQNLSYALAEEASKTLLESFRRLAPAISACRHRDSREPPSPSSLASVGLTIDATGAARDVVLAEGDDERHRDCVRDVLSGATFPVPAQVSRVSVFDLSL